MDTALGVRKACPGRRALAHVTVATAVSLIACAAHAEVCPAATAALESIPAEQRMAFLAERFDRERAPARDWTWTWGLTNAALAGGQLAAIPFTSTRDGQIILAAGAVVSAAAVGQILVFPITPDEPAAPVPEGAGSSSICEALARAERSLERGARNEALGSGTAAQIGNLVVNALFGVAIGATEHWGSGALAFVVGFGIGEAQILTEPRGLVDALALYRAGDLSASSSVSAVQPGVFSVRGGGGVSVAVRF